MTVTKRRRNTGGGRKKKGVTPEASNFEVAAKPNTDPSDRKLIEGKKWS
jgi:hypothetical protein